jgi:hypothetical protein
MCENPNTEVKSTPQRAVQHLPITHSLLDMVNSGLNLAHFGYKDSPEWTRLDPTN